MVLKVCTQDRSRIQFFHLFCGYLSSQVNRYICIVFWFPFLKANGRFRKAYGSQGFFHNVKIIAKFHNSFFHFQHPLLQVVFGLRRQKNGFHIAQSGIVYLSLWLTVIQPNNLFSWTWDWQRQANPVCSKKLLLRMLLLLPWYRFLK